MKYILFLDDERDPSFVPSLADMGYVILIARNYGNALWLIENYGVPVHISLDHDIGLDLSGNEKSGYDLVKAICEMDLDNIISLKGMTYGIHSMNPVGAKNMSSYLDNYLKVVIGETGNRLY